MCLKFILSLSVQFLLLPKSLLSWVCDTGPGCSFCYSLSSPSFISVLDSQYWSCHSPLKFVERLPLATGLSPNILVWNSRFNSNPYFETSFSLSSLWSIIYLFIQHIFIELLACVRNEQKFFILSVHSPFPKSTLYVLIPSSFLMPSCFSGMFFFIPPLLLFIYLFIFDCVGSLLLCVGFL